MFSRIFIERPKLAIVVSTVIVLLGGIMIFMVPVAEYPEVSPPQIMVEAQYPGASAEVIADSVASVMESEVNGIENMIYFSSQSDNSGAYSLTLTFEANTDTDIAQVNVQNAVRRAEITLPSEVTDQGISIRKRGGDILGMFVFLGEKGKISPLELNNFVRINIRDAVARIPGVSEASIFGEKNYSMRIWLDPLYMSSLKIKPDDVADAIRSQNRQAAAGTVGSENSNDYIQLKINTQGRLKTPEEFGNIVIKHGSDGRITRLRDIARIELGSESYSSDSAFNGKEAVAMAIYRNSDANAVNVVDQVKALLEELKPTFPAGVEYQMGYDPTQYIRTTIREIVGTLFLTLVLVVAITYLFLQDWRATVIPALAIPVSLIGTFIFLVPFGFSMNVLTMFALILVIGSLVDDAIVVVENSMRLIEEEHLSPKDAALKSMKQITGAIIATTLVTVAIYAPVGFYGGMVGTIYVQFAVTMCIALCISTFVAMTLSPALCALLLRPHTETRNPLFKGFNVLLGGSKKWYLFFTGIMVRRSLITIVLFALVLLGNWFFFKTRPTSFLPPEDKGAILCEIELPPGATLSRTEKVVGEAYARLKAIPGVKDCITVSGFGFIGGNGENLGLAVVVLDDWNKRTTPDKQINAIHRRVLRELSSLAPAKSNAFLPPAIMGLGMTGGVTFALQAVGNQTPQELASALGGFLGKLNAQPETLYAFSPYHASTPQLYLNLDREKAESMGVPVSRVFSTLQSKLASQYVNDFNMYGLSFKVKLQSESAERSNLSDVTQIYVQNNDGKMLPLSSIADVKYMVGPRQLPRFDLAMSAMVTAQARPGVSSGELMAKIEKLVGEMPRGYRVAWTDMSYQERRNEGRIIWLMLCAFVFGYLFLVGQYESWIMPVPVITSVAVATLGGLLGLLFVNMPLSIYAQLGLLMLIGLASKNAILMVEFSKTLHEQHNYSIEEAALSGAGQRYRAVLMTTWSFVIGVFPMVIATGAGSGSRRAIGVTTFWGMVAASIIGIVFVPALYALFQRICEAACRLFDRGNKNRL